MAKSIQKRSHTPSNGCSLGAHLQVASVSLRQSEASCDQTPGHQGDQQERLCGDGEYRALSFICILLTESPPPAWASARLGPSHLNSTATSVLSGFSLTVGASIHLSGAASSGEVDDTGRILFPSEWSVRRASSGRDGAGKPEALTRLVVGPVLARPGR